MAIQIRLKQLEEHIGIISGQQEHPHQNPVEVEGPTIEKA